MVWHMHKDDSDKDFQSSLPSNFQFDNFTIPHTFSCGKFSQTMVYYAVNVARHQEPQKYSMVWELTTFNLTWCDKTKSVVIHLPIVGMCFQNWRFHQNSQNKRLKKMYLCFCCLESVSSQLLQSSFLSSIHDKIALCFSLSHCYLGNGHIRNVI